MAGETIRLSHESSEYARIRRREWDVLPTLLAYQQRKIKDRHENENFLTHRNYGK